MILSTRNKAFSLLCIMLFALVHNVFPHTHHHHHTVVEENSQFTSHHHHGTHHHEGETPEKSFFNLLVENHTHNKHSHESTFTAVRQFKSEKRIEVKIFSGFDFSVCNNLYRAAHSQKRIFFFRNSLEDQLFSSLHSLRGPPVLG